MGQIDLGQIGTGTNWPKLGWIGLGTNWPVSVNASIKNFVSLLDELWIPINIAGVDPGFQVRGGGAFKKIAQSRGSISCEKSRFYAKKSYFFQFLGGHALGVPPGSAPVLVSGPFALKVGLFALIIK